MANNDNGRSFTVDRDDCGKYSTKLNMSNTQTRTNALRKYAAVPHLAARLSGKLYKIIARQLKGKLSKLGLRHRAPEVISADNTRKLRKVISKPLFAKSDGYSIHLKNPAADIRKLTIKDFSDPAMEVDMREALNAMGLTFNDLLLEYVFKRTASIPSSKAGPAVVNAAKPGHIHSRLAHRLGWPKHPYSRHFDPYPQVYEGNILVKGGVLPTSPKAKSLLGAKEGYKPIRLVADPTTQGGSGRACDGVFATNNPAYAQTYGNAMVAIDPVHAVTDTAGRVVISEHLRKSTPDTRLNNHNKLLNSREKLRNVAEPEAIIMLAPPGVSTNVRYVDMPLTRKGWVARFGTQPLPNITSK